MVHGDDPGSGTAQHYLFETAAGPCGLAWRSKGLTGVQLPEASREATEARLTRRAGSIRSEAPPAAIESWAQQIRAYFQGAESGFEDVLLDMGGVSAFNARVYRALREVGWGESTSYGALAEAAGAPGAARAVGAAMAGNPWPLIVPCHRVLAASGKLGGFSAHGGRDTKRRMLQLERSDADGAAPLLPGLFD